MVQQRTAQAELENQRRQAQELLQTRKQLQQEVADLNERLSVEISAHNAESGLENRHLARHTQLTCSARRQTTAADAPPRARDHFCSVIIHARR